VDWICWRTNLTTLYVVEKPFRPPMGCHKPERKRRVGHGDRSSGRSPERLANWEEWRVRFSSTPHREWSLFRALGVLILSLFVTAGCASMPDPTDAEAVAEFEEINDPGEPANRAVFEFNRGLDTVIVKPAAGMYRHIIPPPVREGIHNALNNLRSPVVFFNDILQGEFGRAGTTLMRFVINSTIGVLGLGDPATDFGFEYHNEDFGQTLATWGVDEGPYIMLPIFGPSNPRDAVGLVVDFISDPLNWWATNTDREFITYSRSGTRAVDGRARNYDVLEDLERSSLDFYAAIRSLYRQRRIDEISNGKSSAIMPAPGLSDEPILPGPRRSPDEISISQ